MSVVKLKDRATKYVDPMTSSKSSNAHFTPGCVDNDLVTFIPEQQDIDDAHRRNLCVGRLEGVNPETDSDRIKQQDFGARPRRQVFLFGIVVISRPCRVTYKYPIRTRVDQTSGVS
jgi:hypothetical protein